MLTSMRRIHTYVMHGPFACRSRLHLELLGLLLVREEQQMLEDYRRMDEFNVYVRCRQPAQPRAAGGTSAPVLSVHVPGIEEHHPPVTRGDHVLLRFVGCEAVEICAAHSRSNPVPACTRAQSSHRRPSRGRRNDETHAIRRCARTNMRLVH